ILGDLSDHVYEESIGVKIFRVLKLIAIRKSKFELKLQDLYKRRLKIAYLDVALEGFLSSLSFVSIGILFWLTYLALKGGEEFSKFAIIGTVVLALQLIDKLIWPMMAIAFSATLFQKAKAASKRFKPIMDLPQFKNGHEKIGEKLERIEIKDLTFSYPGS